MICPVCTGEIVVPLSGWQRLVRRVPDFGVVPQVLRRTGKLPVSMALRCTECDSEIPDRLATQRQGRNLVVPIVGSPQASKTHFMAMVWNDLFNDLLLSKWCANVHADWFGESRKEFEDSIVSLVEAGKPLAGTQPVKQTEGRMNYLQPYYFRAGPDTLTMFDVSGEDFTNPRLKDPSGWGPGLLAADGLVVMLDGADVVARRSMKAGYVELLAGAIRQFQRLGPNRILDIPVLVLLGKADLFGANLRGLDQQMRQVDAALRDADAAEVRRIAATVLEDIGDDTAGFLRSQRHDGTVNMILQNFSPSRMMFLPQSSTGCDKVADAVGDFVFPTPRAGFGNLTAIVWMLHQLGVIRP